MAGGSTYGTLIKRESLGRTTGYRAFQLSGIVLLNFVLYAQAGDELDLPGEPWDACWGLQGVISLAGEVSALGLVLKQAEVAGAVGPSLLSGNQVGQASVLCPCPGLATCSLPWTTPWRSHTPPLVTTLLWALLG